MGAVNGTYTRIGSVIVGALALIGSLVVGGATEVAGWALPTSLRNVLSIIAVAALYCAPGLVLMRLTRFSRDGLPRSVRLALAICSSVALPPLLLLGAGLIGVPWPGAATWAYVLLSVGLILLPVRLALRWPPRLPTLPIAPTLALIGLFAVALAVRLYAVRDLRVGLLGDSYQHTLMVQLLRDHRGLFQSWQPYAPLTTFTYHFGFHANALFIHDLTGLDVIQSVIWAGQVLNALVVVAIFGLAASLAENPGAPTSRWAAVWAAAITGLIGTIPAFYVNWGRYTQLTGQIVAIGVIIAWMHLREREDPQDGALPASRWPIPGGDALRSILFTGLMTAAMMLTHYLVGALAALLVLSYLVVAQLVRRSWQDARGFVVRAGLSVLFACLVTAPWFWNLVRGHLLRNATGLVSGGSGRAVVEQLSMLEPVAPMYVKGYILLLAMVGLLIAAWVRDWRRMILAIWYGLLILVVVPYLVGLPGAGVIDRLTGFGTLFIPAAILAGYAVAVLQHRFAELADRVTRWLMHQLRIPRVPTRAAQWAVNIVGVVMVCAIIATNVAWQIRIVTPETALVVDADLAAADWIRQNTPVDARFLVNSFPAYGGNLAAGTDAGWWLPLLANRQVSLPPLTYGSEQGDRPDYQIRVNVFVKQLRGRPLSDSRPIRIDLTQPGALKLLAENRFDYVYSGAHPFPGPKRADRFDTEKMRSSPYFKLVYAAGGVEIFRVLGP